MAESARQKRVTGRVMHEFKHGELKSGPGGKGGSVKSRRQAIAIALEETGASKYESNRRNQRHLHRTEQKEAEGRTAQQEREGKSHIGASHKREKAPLRWMERMPKSRPPGARRQQRLAPAAGTAIPVRSFMRRRSSGTSKAVQR
jgi:hypothetical protein